MSDDKDKLEQSFRLERLKNIENTIRYHRDQINTAFKLFVAGTAVVWATIVGLLTREHILTMNRIALIIGGWFVSYLVGSYSKDRIRMHTGRAQELRMQEREQLLGVLKENDPEVPQLSGSDNRDMVEFVNRILKWSAIGGVILLILQLQIYSIVIDRLCMYREWFCRFK